MKPASHAELYETHLILMHHLFACQTSSGADLYAAPGNARSSTAPSSPALEVTVVT